MLSNFYGESYVANLLTNHVRDPQATKTDAELIEALKRAWLLPREGAADVATEAKFSLDASVNDEGPFEFIVFRVHRLTEGCRFKLQRRREAASSTL